MFVRNSNDRVFVGTPLANRTKEQKKLSSIANKLSTRQRNERKPSKAIVTTYITTPQK